MLFSMGRIAAGFTAVIGSVQIGEMAEAPIRATAPCPLYGVCVTG